MRRFVVRLAVFALVFLTVAEVGFRTVVPAAQLPYQVQDTEDMVLRLAPSPTASGYYSIGRLARQRLRWQVNQAGWNSTVEYRPAAARSRPCIAVIGNSFVEGFHTDVDSGLTATLARELHSQYDVYNFGKSAVVASQMVHVAHYVQHHFAPEVYVFVLNHASLRESVVNFGGVAYNQLFRWTDGDLVDVPPEQYQPNPLRLIRAHSALGRYLYNNAGGIHGFRTVRQEATQRNSAEAEARARAEQPVLELVAQRVVSDIRADHPDALVLFVLDGDREGMYDLRRPARAAAREPLPGGSVPRARLRLPRPHRRFLAGLPPGPAAFRVRRQLPLESARRVGGGAGHRGLAARRDGAAGGPH